MPTNIKRLRLHLITAFFTLASLTTTKGATSIVSYSFGTDSTSGTLLADVGASRSTLSWNSGGSVGYANTFAGQGAALSVGSFQTGEYYELTLNASGCQDIAFNSFRANGSDTAPASWKIAYSLSGTSGSFTDAAAFSLVNATALGSTTIAGFSLPSEANDNASIILRFIATTSTRVDGAIAAANGTFRIDNLSFSATAIPELETQALVTGLAFLGLAFRQRLKKARPSSPSSGPAQSG
ncbi:MAG: hypothetical protein JF599_05400 [Verrucomicrobia bacterium]|nr:hypothetical protein [Verrucomicrobiota bacterium]